MNSADRAPYRPYGEYDADQPFENLAARCVGLRCACYDCAHEVEITGDALVRRFGARTTIPQLQPRLICSACKTGRVFVYPITVGPSRWAWNAPQ